MDSKHVIGLYEAYLDVYSDQEDLQEAPYQIYGPDPHGPSDAPSQPLGKPYKNKKRAKSRADKLDQEIGGYRHSVRYVPEEVDLYDVVLEYLLDEGYCDDVESAEIIMANMSEEWLDGILESIEDYSDSKLDKSGKTAYKASQHLVNRHQRYLGRNMGKMHPADREEKFSRMRGRIDSRRKEISKESDRREDEKIARTKAFLKSLGL